MKQLTHMKQLTQSHRPSIKNTKPSTRVGNSLRRAALGIAVAGMSGLLLAAPASLQAQNTPIPINSAGTAVERGRDSAGDTMTGFTEASDKRELSFEVPGLVWKVDVVEGQTVDENQVLAVQDIRQDEIEYKALRAVADSGATVKQAEIAVDTAKVIVTASELTLKQKQVELKRVANIHDSGAGNDTELEKAQLDVGLAEQELAKSHLDVKKAEMDVEKAKLEQVQNVAKADKQELHLKLMTLRSPIKGIVAKVEAHGGEMAVADRGKPAYTVVCNDPLWVEFSLPATQAQQLAKGQVLKVSHDDKTWEDAKVIFLNPVADATSATQQVRLELPNPANRSSGLQVRVQLPKEIVAGNQAAAR